METIKVAVRIRPSNTVLTDTTAIKLLSENPPVLFVKDRQEHYTFDNVFSHDATQEQVYEQLVRPLLNKVLLGYNCTIFAYGQTGTGKTYTIGSDPQTYRNVGFILRTLDDVFAMQEEHREICVSISFYEIYNEKIFDLLSSSETIIPIKGFQILGLTQPKVKDIFQARELLKQGSKNRHTGSTKQNRNSSRSHAVFTIHCSVKNENFETEAKLNLVDLAGSESAGKSGCEGSQFEEGININMGLLYVGRVVNALSTNMSHIPYRGSVLTTVLKDSLDKRNYITFVACISPDSEDMHETIQTLQFAQRAKRLKNKPEVTNVVQQFKNDNPSLFEKQPIGSAVKVRPTPRKCPSSQPLRLSKPKKQAIKNCSWTPLNTIDEPNNDLSSRSLFSVNMSSISTISDAASISPIVHTLQATMVEKFESLIKTQSRKSTPDNTNSPQWHSELRHIIRSAFTTQRSRACSSPVTSESASSYSSEGNLQETKVSKRLTFDEKSPNSLAEPLNTGQVDPLVFKVPTALPRKRKKKIVEDDQTVLASEIVGPTPRRSIRLSLRKKPSVQRTVSPVKQRQSKRLSMKNQELPESTPGHIQSEIYPTPAPRKKIKVVTPATTTSPASNHNQYILNVLNMGDQKELQKLPAIGFKTAAQIYFYRKLNGIFGCIADVGKMESWRGNGFDRFLKANFLKIDAEDER